MFKRMLIMLVVVGVIFGGIFGYHAFGSFMMKKYFAGSKEPPAVVSTISATRQSWQPQVKAVGTLRAVQGVDVSSEIPGMVQKVFFRSGDQAKAGQVLLRLNVDTDIAQLHALEAAAMLAQTVYTRDRKQLEIQAVSRAVVDADAAELKSRRAQVSQQVAVVAKKVIRAPFDGQLGISSINPGQYLNPGEKIVTLQALESVYIDFYLPQQELSRITLGQKVDLATDAYPERMFTGKITAINPRVDPDSRNVQVEALIPNPGHELLPGMFATVEVEVGSALEHLTLPQTAVALNPYGETVYIVTETGKDADGKPVLTAKQTFVTVGETRGDQLVVLSGVKEGDTVVTAGQLKLRNGSKVIINNQIQPANEANPKPVDQ
jgi:membrane fusion protein (multidrug efflux system)